MYFQLWVCKVWFNKIILLSNYGKKFISPYKLLIAMIYLHTVTHLFDPIPSENSNTENRFIIYFQK